MSAKLGVALGATYHHVPNKHALLVLIADELYGRIVSGAITKLRPETMTSEEATARFADGLDVVLTGIEMEVERQLGSDGARQRT